MGYSLIISTFNRTDFVIEAFTQVLDNKAINEIVIVDDFSSLKVYTQLFNLINNLQNKKIKLYRNEKNLGPLLNKYEAVKKSSNEWVILLDSDNIINNDYISKIEGLEKERDILYCPEILWGVAGKKKIGWNYGKFRGIIIDRGNVKNYIGDGLFETWLNTGNYFFNRKVYLDNIEKSELELGLGASDSIYFSYLWLMNGNRMKIVPKLSYVHRVHRGSWYKNHYNACGRATRTIKEKIRIL